MHVVRERSVDGGYAVALKVGNAVLEAATHGQKVSLQQKGRDTQRNGKRKEN